MEDARGRLWQARAGFVADQNGVVDPRSQAPEAGDYEGVDPMGLIHVMQPSGDPDPFTRFSLPLNQPVSIRFTLDVNSREHTSVEVTRSLSTPGLEVLDVRDHGLVGQYFKPPGDGPFPGVLVLGGSGGGQSGATRAKLLASNGFAVLTVAYFRADGVPQSLQEIPVEYFKKAIDWLSGRPGVEAGGVGILGTSRGSEAALWAGALYPEVRSVVAIAPSSVSWTCICDDGLASSWSVNGKGLPYAIPQNDPSYQQEPGTPFRVITRFVQGLKDHDTVEAARIPVENIKGSVLLVSGTDDQLWPSSTMSEMIMEQLAASNFPFPYKHIAIKDAGHSIRSSILPLAGTSTTRGGRISLGGTYDGIRRSQSSWKEIIAFLRSSVPGTGNE